MKHHRLTIGSHKCLDLQTRYFHPFAAVFCRFSTRFLRELGKRVRMIPNEDRLVRVDPAF